MKISSIRCACAEVGLLANHHRPDSHGVAVGSSRLVAQMKDTHDKLTGDLLPVPKKRGRPPTGRAKSNALKCREYRARQKMELEKLRALLSSAPVVQGESVPEKGGS